MFHGHLGIEWRTFRSLGWNVIVWAGVDCNMESHSEAGPNLLGEGKLIKDTFSGGTTQEEGTDTSLGHIRKGTSSS